jgi:serine protease inhibitor
MDLRVPCFSPQEVAVMKRRLSSSAVCVLVLVGVCFVGCSDDDGGRPAAPDPGGSNPISAADIDSRLVDADTRFAFRLLAELTDDGVTENIFISPPSIAFALTMTLNGAGGDTYDGMAEVLEIDELTLEEINEANATLKAWLEQNDTEVQLSIANSIWVCGGEPVLPDFLERCQDYFAAEASTLNCADPAAPDLINAWVSEATQDKITEIIQEIRANTAMILVNAIYFKGTWTYQFDEAETADRLFTMPDGSQKMHPTMHQMAGLEYLWNEGFQAVRLPYGDDRMSMYVFLPNEASSLVAFLDGLSPEAWENWMGEFGETDVDVALPKFKLEYGVELNDALKSLGMDVAFSAEADFSPMLGSDGYWIGEVLHKTFVEVNEQGTEAAAASSVSIEFESAPPAVMVDRPFFCVIRDDLTGTILFMGAIVEPVL